MEKKLSVLFDYQKYSKNAHLQAVIDRVHARYPSRQLSDDEAEFVAAAGRPNSAPERDPSLKSKDDTL
ncbi:MAG: hypothetical protein IJJ23_00630 [Clostridia bacterium]|nr:hypothetical protein [Clostridia bacterium]